MSGLAAVFQAMVLGHDLHLSIVQCQTLMDTHHKSPRHLPVKVMMTDGNDNDKTKPNSSVKAVVGMTLLIANLHS